MARPKKLKKKEIEELNEFNDSTNRKDKSCFVPQEGKLKDPIKIRIRNDLTEKQKGLIELIKDKQTNIVFIDGPSGTTKTFCAVQAGLELLNDKKVSDILFTRVFVQSANVGSGFAPGSLEDKFSLFCGPLEDKLGELLDSGTIKFLKGDGRINMTPVGYLRGSSWNARYIICEESGQMSESELKTVITRLGKHSKLVIIGDSRQCDIRNSGFRRVFDMFNDGASREKGIYCLEFTTDDILRNGILKFIIERFESEKIYN